MPFWWCFFRTTFPGDPDAHFTYVSSEVHFWMTQKLWYPFPLPQVHLSFCVLLCPSTTNFLMTSKYMQFPMTQISYCLRCQSSSAPALPFLVFLCPTTGCCPILMSKYISWRRRSVKLSPAVLSLQCPPVTSVSSAKPLWLSSTLLYDADTRYLPCTIAVSVSGCYCCCHVPCSKKTFLLPSHLTSIQCNVITMEQGKLLKNTIPDGGVAPRHLLRLDWVTRKDLKGQKKM